MRTHVFQASGDKDKGSQLVTYEAMAFGEVGVIMYVFSIRMSRDDFLTKRLNKRMFDRQFKSHTPQAAGTAKQSQVGPSVCIGGKCG